MSRRLVVAAAAALAIAAPTFAGSAFAQDAERPVSLDVSPAFISSFGPSIRLADFDVPETQLQLPQTFRPRDTQPSPVMLSLYASTAIVQALDTHSTLVGLDRGAYEANPLMSGFAKNKAAFIGVKAAVAVGTIYAAREMAKKNKVAAIVTLVAINSVYAYVAHHNYRVAGRLR